VVSNALIASFRKAARGALVKISNITLLGYGPISRTAIAIPNRRSSSHG
jgi:hypothetical protein